MKYDVLNNFERNLKNNPQLMYSSVRVYLKLIIELTNKYGIDPTVEQLNEFIAYKCQKRQASVVQAALRYYIKFRWRNWPKIYTELVKAKARPVAKKKNFLTKAQSTDIINSMSNSEHKLIAKIQYFTGARASEVISIKKSNMVHEKEYKRIRINIVGKGDKVNPIYLTDNLMIDLQLLLIRKGVYLFLKLEDVELSDEDLRRKTETYYKRYYDSVKQAAKNCDLNISTHDWRRSFAQALIDMKDDEGKELFNIYDVKRALRHERFETTERYFKDDEGKVAKTMLRHQTGF